MKSLLGVAAVMMLLVVAVFPATVTAQQQQEASETTTTLLVPSQRNSRAFLMLPTNATNSSTSSNSTDDVVATAKPDVSMTWEAWLVVACIVVLLVVLVADLSPVSSAMVFLSMFLYLSTIVSKTELFVGFTNNGVLSIAILFIIVHPIAELPLVKKLVVATLSGSTDSNTWPLFKLCALSMVLSSFIENTPHVAMFTPLVTKFCVENGLAPSQFLLPMNYAVILGNYAVVGCSSNLVVSGLMEENGMGQMDFFELAKIGAPQLIFFLAYLVIMPKYLLPKDKGGMTGMVSAEKQKKFIIKLKVHRGSSLIGKKYIAVEAATETTDASPKPAAAADCAEFCAAFPGGASTSIIAINSVRRNGELYRIASSSSAATTKSLETSANNSNADSEVTSPHAVVVTDDVAKNVEAEMTCEEGDVIIATGAPKQILMSADILGFSIITANDNSAVAMVDSYEQDAQLFEIEMKNKNTEPISDDTNTVDIATPSASSSSSTKKYLYEVVLAGGCSFIDTLVKDRGFQINYGVSIISIRRSRDATDCTELELPEHRLAAGDTLLVYGSETFKKKYENTKTDFLLIAALDGKIDSLNPFIFTFPAWFPFGTLVGGPSTENKERDAEASSATAAPATTSTSNASNTVPRKVVIFPPEYQYLTLVIFVAIVVAAVFHLPLAVLCLGGAILYVVFGIVSTSQAIKMIHLEVYVLVAMSFPLGIAVKKSGLASVIGEAIADIHGFQLLLVISFISMVMTNLITNKASCQVMFPIIVEVYKAQNEDPLPAIMVATTVVVFALCTPYGIPPNVIVMGPGGYTGIDYLKFGLPVTLMGTILTPIAAALVYGVAW